MTRTLSRITVLLMIFWTLLIVPSHTVWAWTEHPLIIREVLAAIPEIRDAKPVKAENLDAFLLSEEKNLAALIAGEEQWARQSLAWYKSLPEGQQFTYTGKAGDIRERFCHAIRINPCSRFSLYIQCVPDMDPGGRPHIRAEQVTFLKNTSDWKSTVFVRLDEGEQASPLDIASTAADEPDFGLDIGLYEDNDSAFGKSYGLGIQPFGDPALEYGSQAPFHMGYYHESRIISTLAPFVNQTYPEYRIHLYKTLSEHAFRTGHEYWGWRFMGIGLHYVMDLTQPDHTTLLPGVSIPRMLWIDALDLLGTGGPKKDAVRIVSNRHMAVEKFQQVILQDAYREKDLDNPVFRALRSVTYCPKWDDRMPRSVISARSSSLAGKTDRIMKETMPRQWIGDPSFELGTSPELDGIMDMMKRGGGDSAIHEATALLQELLEPLPCYSCSYVRSILVK